MTAEFAVAVHAMELLHHKGAVLSSETIAQNVCTHPVRVRRVLAKLERAGLVTGKNGQQGGYCLAHTAAEITLLDIFNAVCTTLFKTVWRSGDIDMDCMIASGMAGVMDDVYEAVDQSGRETLRGITLADIDHRLFQNGGQLTDCHKKEQ
ncbi:MAG: Rrf2 family transcriptional regulator [Clostridiales bacterium]|nr:Rrf2 family transcriptional regulator [Clostridiales bacterium]